MGASTAQGVQGICPCPVSFLPLFFAGPKKSGEDNMCLNNITHYLPAVGHGASRITL